MILGELDAVFCPEKPTGVTAGREKNDNESVWVMPGNQDVMWEGTLSCHPQVSCEDEN